MESSDSDTLSSRLRLNSRRVRRPRTVGGAELIGPRLARVPNGRLSSPSTPMEREAHLGASENAAQSSSSDDTGNTPHLPSSLQCSNGVIHPRARGDPFLKDILPPSPQSPVATLAHGLERVLFRRGVQWLQDPRSKVYSFSTWLEQIIPVKNFAFERLQTFVPSSRDEDLYAVAKREGRKYAGSTSSLSGLLSQLYYLISDDKLVNTADLSRCFRSQARTFTKGQRGAASVILNYRDGVYLIDSAEEAVPGLSRKNILTWMGTLLEKFLTQSPTEFVRLTRSVDNSAVVGKEPRREAYRYAKSDKFALRSQLDCSHSRLPGTGVFDIKTRAVTAIRHDLLNFEENSGYQIRTIRGLIESFEKEYYDLIRSAFLKYSFQARIGNMDGVFVAYHNTERIFGFQYIPLSEMDARLFGEHASGNAVFEKCMQLLEAVLEIATRELPHQSIRLTAEKRKREKKLRVFLEPAEWDELQGSKPVIELDVSIKHYICESATDGQIAVERSSQPWTVHWSVSKTHDPNVVRKTVTGARRRATYPLFLPRGVTLRQMKKFWHELQFNPVVPVEVPFKAEMFHSPPNRIRSLRLLARKGRRRLEHSIRKQKGRPKLVKGIPDDAQKVAPLLALAHAKNLRTAAPTDTSSQPSRTTEQTTQVHAVPKAKPFAEDTNATGSGEFIPETKSVHSEEMPSEDQK
ncbi:mitochondrial protein Pet127-domain-containing protein [Russula emetica]|nr:mitochondrial protein Pet127-domain-containing protein [Russula emetica]